jgi:hypothetical protein
MLEAPGFECEQLYVGEEQRHESPEQLAVARGGPVEGAAKCLFNELANTILVAKWV